MIEVVIFLTTLIQVAIHVFGSSPVREERLEPPGLPTWEAYPYDWAPIDVEIVLTNKVVK